jgi:hypothetical protein
MEWRHQLHCLDSGGGLMSVVCSLASHLRNRSSRSCRASRVVADRHPSKG